MQRAVARIAALCIGEGFGRTTERCNIVYRSIYRGNAIRESGRAVVDRGCCPRRPDRSDLRGGSGLCGRRREQGGYVVVRAQEARVGVRVAVSRIHRIEGGRGMVGTVVGCFGGEEYRAVDVHFPDGAQRLFWPQDLEAEPRREGAASPRPRWWRLLLRNRG